MLPKNPILPEGLKKERVELIGDCKELTYFKILRESPEVRKISSGMEEVYL